ncbi:thymidine phosphorylase [Tichowtungia aerotolerans]|uniref:thymidine phosphorylase n=2 Tax=Tichowtungia aerotolerans TaxID=2697043 RepID=A0A6P1MIH6_9BACT|nr:thymidine phosphorylase [Tichowtungia aerotolerans]
MLPQWIIERKREGNELSADEIRFFIEGFTEGSIPDYQMSALAMAICFQGMTPAETAALTTEMMLSGETIDPASLPGIKADKHSTGGIGDKTSLILAPLAAACGLTVPMISGRGLGITGGTLDKLESIPGYRTNLSEKEFFQTLENVGCSIIGQTAQLAPADKKLYALRDVTGTVPSIPLITASIMSKKLAEGLDTLVLDVKWGKGAFMKTREEARQLAQAMVDVGRAMDKKVRALITDMNQPLGRAAGNVLEVQECIEVLRGGGPDDLRELTVALTAHMLELSNVHKTNAEIFQCLENGTAMKKFEEMVAAQGGSTDWKFAAAKIQEPVLAPADGIVTTVDADLIGKACLVLGAGRQKTDDTIDHAVGIGQMKKPGEEVKKGDSLAVIFSNDRNCFDESLPMVGNAFELGDHFEPQPLVCEVVG